MIGRLLRQAFESRYLLLSIYSNPLGDRHLERSIREHSPEANGLQVRLVRSGEDVLGCTIVSVRGGAHHLDYVAVAPLVAGSGVGSELLNDALESAHGQLSLDVFASNEAVHDWYLRKGFEDHEVRTVQVVDLCRVRSAKGLDNWSHAVVSRGLEAESAQGFGEFTIALGSHSYRFGLLGESTVRLFDCPDGLVDSAVSLARTLLPDRRFLNLPIGQEHPELPSHYVDQTIRMVRQE